MTSLPSRVRVTAVGMVIAVLAAMLVAPRARAVTGSNPVVEENAKPGNTGWQIPTPGNTVADDATNQIKGYASATSVNKGGSIGVHVTVNPAQSFSVDVYRLGYYGGAGARLVRSISPVSGVTQPACPFDAPTGAGECRWPRSLTLDVPPDWVSGLYFAVLTSAQHFQNYIVFTVRDDARPSDLLLQQTVTTYQAYNNYPFTKRLYENNSSWSSTATGTVAVRFCFARPYKDSGAGDLFQSEANVVGWVERMG